MLMYISGRCWCGVLIRRYSCCTSLLVFFFSGQLHRADQWYVQVLVEGLPRCRDGSPFCSSFSFLSRPPQHRYHEQCHVTQWECLVGRVEGWLVGSGLVAFSSVFLLLLVNNGINSLNTTWR